MDSLMKTIENILKWNRFLSFFIVVIAWFPLFAIKDSLMLISPILALIYCIGLNVLCSQFFFIIFERSKKI